MSCSVAVHLLSFWFVLAGLQACSSERSPGGATDFEMAATQGTVASGPGDDSASSEVPSSETGSTPSSSDSASSVDSSDSASSLGSSDASGGSTKFDLSGAGSGPMSSGGPGNDGDDGANECVPSSQKEEACEDDLDNDCDGKPDCQDADCIWAQKCLGCVPIGSEVCYAGFDDDCNGVADCDDPVCKDAPDCLCNEVCVPGKQRWCDGPPRCSWGKSTCTPQGTWGPCLEVGAERPAGCEHEVGMKYDMLCCYNSPDACCQEYPWTKSTGECEGIAKCTAPPDDDPTGSTSDGMPPDDEPTASASTTSTSTTTGPPDR